jgi:hypothetical protein
VNIIFQLHFLQCYRNLPIQQNSFVSWHSLAHMMLLFLLNSRNH